MQRSGGERPERRRPPRFETERDRRQSGEAQADQCAGKARAYRMARQHDRKHAKTDRHGPRIGGRSVRDDGQGLLRKRAVPGSIPSTAGVWSMRICPAMPMRKPVVTGMTEGQRRSQA